MRIREPKPNFRKNYKSGALVELERLANAEDRRKHPNVDVKYLAPLIYYDHDTNSLTKAVLAWLTLNGHHAERINTTGRPIDNRKTYIDVLGNQRTIGSVTWIKTAGQRGSADISAIVNGKPVRIEIKFGADRQSKAQKEYQAQVEASGGTYLIVRSFQGFYDWYMEHCTE
jgi:hypothetical protein